MKIKRQLAFLLVWAMILTMMPSTVFASALDTKSNGKTLSVICTDQSGASLNQLVSLDIPKKGQWIENLWPNNKDMIITVDDVFYECVGLKYNSKYKDYYLKYNKTSNRLDYGKYKDAPSPLDETTLKDMEISFVYEALTIPVHCYSGTTSDCAWIDTIYVPVQLDGNSGKYKVKASKVISTLEAADYTVTCQNVYNLAIEHIFSPNHYSLWNYSFNNGSQEIQFRNIKEKSLEALVTETTNYTVSYDANGGSTAPTDVNKYAAGSTVTVKSAVTKTGYTFDGWSNGTTTYQAGTNFPMPADNVNLTAVWEANTNTKYKVNHYTENLDGSWNLEESETLEGTTGTTATAITAPPTGFQLDSDSLNNKLSGTITEDGNLVLSVYYERIPCALGTVVDEGVVVEGLGTQDLIYGSTSTAIVFKPIAGYKIISVKVNDVDKSSDLAADGTYIFAAQTITDDINIEVKSARLFEVNFNLNGGAGTTPDSIENVSGSAFTAPAQGDIQKPNYIFLGWSEDEKATTAAFTAGSTYSITGDATLYAVWKQNVFSVKYYVYNKDKVLNPLTAGHIKHDSGLYTKGGWSGTVTGDFTFARSTDGKQEVMNLSGLTFDKDSAALLTKYNSRLSTDKGVEVPNGCKIVPFRLVKENDGIHVDCWIVPDPSVTFTVNYLPGTQGKFAPQSIYSLIYGTPMPLFGGDTTNSNLGYVFDGWDTTPAAIVTNHVNYTAQWQALNAAYTIEYYKQDVADAENYIMYNTTTGSGIIGNNAVVTPDSITGFKINDNNSELSKEITEDGKTKLKVYYDRETFAVEGVLNDTSMGIENVMFEATSSAITFNAPTNEHIISVTVSQGGIETTPDDFEAGKKTYVFGQQSNVQGAITVTVTTSIDRAITVKAGDATKYWDGTTLTTGGSITVGELATGDSIEIITAGSQTAVGTTTNAIAGLVIKNIKGTNVTGSYKVAQENGTLTVLPNEMTATAGGIEVTYDGQIRTINVETSVQGVIVSYKVGNDDWTTEVPRFKDIKDSATVLVKVEKEGYTAVEKEVTVAIAARELTIETGSTSRGYDGTPLTNSTVSVEGIDTGDAINVAAVGNITTVGAITNDVTIDATPAILANYNVNKTLGTLTISQRDITVTAGDAEKYWDGTELTAGSSITDGTLATGDAIEILTVGSQMSVGTTTNAISSVVIKNTQGADVTASYNIDKANGTLTVLSNMMTVTTGGIDVTYDGQRRTINVETSEQGATVSYKVGNNDWTTEVPSFKDVIDSATVLVKIEKEGFTTVDKEVTVDIEKRNLTITADSASKRYDGSALTDSGWMDTTPAGIVAGDQLIYVNVTGSAINTGSIPNVASNAVIVRPYGEMARAVAEQTPTISEEDLTLVRSSIAEAIADYNAGNLNQKELENTINNIVSDFGENVTSNYAITYVDGALTITAASSGGKKNNNSTTIEEEEVPLAGTPELNKVDHFNYVKGYEDGNVKAQNNITREEVATIFYRLLTDPSRAIYFSQEEDFSDIADTRWSLNAIATLANGGIIEGYNDGTFGASKAITRAEFAAIASRFDVLEEVEGTNFSDTAGNWAESYINSAAKKGWITGYSNGTFKPNQNITRAEAMTLINRVLERRVNEAGLIDGYKVFPDNKSTDWFYYQVIEATNNHDYAERKSMSDMETWTKIKEDKTWTE